MAKISKLMLFINIIIIKLFSCKYCGIGRFKYNVKNPPITKRSLKSNNNKRNLDTNDFRPIKIYLDTTNIDKMKGMFENVNNYNLVIEALQYTSNMLEKLIKVKPLNYKISISYEDLESWNIDVKDDLKTENGVDKDLAIICKVISTTVYKAAFEQKYIDPYTKRPVVGILYFSLNFDFEIDNPLRYLKVMFMHQFTHILGFYNESFSSFTTANGDISKIITSTQKDKRSQMPRTYVHSPKVLEFAKKYFNCKNDIIGVDLEDQEDGKYNSHWDARVLLGEYMNAEPYNEEQVISEFTLALLEDSGWYEVNYYTGGLMRYGKNKGCNFLNKDCVSPSIFKNEFFNSEEEVSTPSCSSGRLSRTYCNSFQGTTIIEFVGFEKYYRFDGKYGVVNADFCLAFNSLEKEIDKFGYSVGNCLYGNSNYGAYIKYLDGNTHQNGDLPKKFGEEYGDNSFCILTSASLKGTNEFYKFDNSIIHPMCYPIYCSDESLTIKIYDQYVVCPRSGGKVQVNGIYEGYLFCPDYNLLCTGTTMCNDMFSCIEKESKSKENTYTYDYTILTNQIKSELINEYSLVGYELSTNGKCPQYCEQCKDVKRCFKCKSDYNLIGYIENDDKPIRCDNTIDVSIGYYQNNETKVYYNCTEFCQKCNRIYCTKCDGIHKLNEDNKTCIDKVANCETYNDNFDCIKCKPDYCFIGNNRDECKTIDKRKYYTLDGGISYFPCNTAIPYCDLCYNDNTKCTQCEKGYYFLEDDRVNCINDKDLSEYYSEDDNISYYPCYKGVSNCLKCSSKLMCTKCFEHLYLLIKGNKRECSDVVDDTYYTEDNGKTYHQCREAMSNCERCTNKNNCIKCDDDYGFFEKYKNRCVYIADNRYYTEDETTYYLCSKSMPNCERCLNKNYCIICFKGSYFIEYERDKCYNDKNLSKYYTEDYGISYFLCENNCDTCYNKTVCKSCISQYYFVGDDRNMCYKIDIEKYYSINGGVSYLLCADKMEHCEKCHLPNYCDECENNYYFVNKVYNKCININKKKYYYDEETNSYFPCNLNIDNCDECFNGATCNKCISPYILLYESPIKCNEESFYINDRTYFKLNESFYEKCSTAMSNCLYCDSINNCEECHSNYYFLNRNFSRCIYESYFVPKNEYYKVDNKNYYSCDYTIDHCKICTNGTICIRCKDDYAFVWNNFKKCISKKELEKKYYPNEDGTIYYPCLKDCDVCKDGLTCIKCSPKYITIYDDTQCQMCELEVINIDNELNENNKNEYISSYINSNQDKITKIMLYINNKYNYTITIFKLWECTGELLEKDYYKINTRDLTLQITKKFNIDRTKVVYYFITHNYNNYLEIYNGETGQKLNLNNDCPECINTGFIITNNYTTEIKNELGDTSFEKVKQFNIDVFNKGDPYLNDICNNFTIAKIDLSIMDRRKYFNYGQYTNEIICTDKSCEFQSKENAKFLGTCTCPIKTDFNNFKNFEIIISLPSDEIKSYDTSITVFKCFKSGFSKSISSNTGFYLFLFFIIIQIVSFLIFFFFENKTYPKKTTISNPPFKSKNDDNLLFIEDFNIIENNNSNIKNFQNVSNELQDRDEAENLEEFVSDYTFNSKDEDTHSRKTQLEDYSRYKREEYTDLQNGQNTKDQFIEYNNNNDDDNMSRNKFINYKQNFKRKFNFRSNDNFRDFLLLNNKKDKTNKTKKNRMSETFYLNTEGNKYNKTINYNLKPNEKFSKILDIPRIRTQTSENDVGVNEQIIPIKDHLSSMKRSIMGSVYNLNYKEVDNFSFCGFYWYLLGLKQPILNLTSQIKMFKITESFIPHGIKVIRFIFMIALNFFVNSLFLSQKYYSDKFNYFDRKYNLRHKDIGMDIPTTERFSYAFKYTEVFSVISFIICYIIQSVLNYFYFNIRNNVKEICINYNNDEEKLKEFLRMVIKQYYYIFIIDMVFMILFACYIINFSAVYIGGDLDYISASILTFIFLQVFPFFVCLILTIIRYLGIKISSELLYQTSQILAF